jgi:hypothetical protein
MDRHTEEYGTAAAILLLIVAFTFICLVSSCSSERSSPMAAIAGDAGADQVDQVLDQVVEVESRIDTAPADVGSNVAEIVAGINRHPGDGGGQ